MLVTVFANVSLQEIAVKGGSGKGKEPVIDMTGFYDVGKFRSYATFQSYENYFKDAPLLVERVVKQASLLDMNIPKWFATKD